MKGGISVRLYFRRGRGRMHFITSPPERRSSRRQPIVKLAFHDADGHRHRHGHPRRLPHQDRPRAGHARGSSPTCPTRGAIFLARMSVRDARVYTCTVHDKLPCIRLQNYTIGASVMSVSVSVPWNSRIHGIWNSMGPTPTATRTSSPIVGVSCDFP